MSFLVHEHAVVEGIVIRDRQQYRYFYPAKGSFATVSIRAAAQRLHLSRGFFMSAAIVALIFAVILAATYLDSVAIMLGAVALVLMPAQVVFALLLGIEEEVIAGGHSVEAVSPLVRVGSDFFMTSFAGLRLPLLVILAGAILILLRYRKGFSPLPLALVSFLVLWTVLLAAAQGFSPSGAMAAATPWLIVLSGYVFGTYIAGSAGLRRQVVWISAAVLTVKAAVGLLVFVRGEAIPDPTGLASVVYYDSTLSYVAMTFLISWMYSTERRWPGQVLMVSSVVVLLVAMRRNVVAATGWAFLAVSLMRGAWRQTLKVAVVLGLVLLAASVFLSGPLANIGGGFERAITTLLTGEGDSSTTGHVNDIQVGFQVIMQSPLWGLGVYPSPQAGLVVGDSANLYIHNELLQTWARFGLGGLAILVAILGLGVVYACRVVLKGTSDILGLAAAVFFLASPIPLMFFPHLSTLVRFGFFTGLFLAILSEEARKIRSADVCVGDTESALGGTHALAPGLPGGLGHKTGPPSSRGYGVGR